MKLLVFLMIFPLFVYGTSNYKSVLIENVPHVKQRPDFCGEACTEMYLRKLGFKVDQNYVFNQSGLDPKLGRGCYTPNLVKALKNIGFDVGQVWYRIAVAKASLQISAQWHALHRDLLKGIPSIICMHYDDSANTTEHFRLVLGYDSIKDEVIYHEPAVSGGKYRRMKKKLFLKLWPLKYKKKYWTVVRIPLKVKKIEVKTAQKGFSNADYAQHIRKLKKKIPKGFTLLIQPPFVVLGDESSYRVRRRSENTIKWAVDKLKQIYFSKDPEHIIDVWLFKNKKSYRKYTKEIFDDNPSTPYGYYSYSHRALIMNIATGGGTLVHEIVHPFIRSNFPTCPSWFNEGLASLYEQCGEKGGYIHGYTNWRLKGLKRAIKNESVPSFKNLTATTSDEFYGEDSGTNYAQARYLCYYLQQNKLLVKYYHQFRKNCKNDPTGYKTLQKILKVKDMSKFKQKWERFVLKLRY